MAERIDRFELLLPLIGLLLYFLVALALFTIQTLRSGLPVDGEVAERPASRLLGRYLRHYLMWVLAPYERWLVRAGVSPNAVTLASLATAIGAAVALALGHFAVGGWLYLLTGILDILDGRIARATGRESRAGAFFDSVIDRYAELAVFSGLAVYYRSSPALVAVLLAAIGSVMVSYVRARGEALGVDVKVGTMQRPERLLYLGAVVAHSPLWEALRPSTGRPLYAPVVVALALLGLTANVTAVRRIMHALRQLEPPRPAAAPTPLPERRRRIADGFEAGARRLLARLRTAG